MDTIVAQRLVEILKLLAGKEDMILARQNTLLAVNLCLDIGNTVTQLHPVKGNVLTSNGLHENLKAIRYCSLQSRHRVDSLWIL